MFRGLYLMRPWHVYVYREVWCFQRNDFGLSKCGLSMKYCCLLFRLLKLDLLATYGLSHIKLHSRFSSANLSLGCNQ